MSKEDRKKKTTKETKKKKKHIGLKIFLAIILVILIAGGVFAYKVKQNGGGLEGVLVTTLGHDKNTVTTLPEVYCLLLGQSQNLTDTIMLASYDPKTQEASLLSIPRDTFIGDNKNTATPWDKINALSQDSPKKTLKAVSKITGIDVENYILIDTEALVEVVDLIGGVWFDVPIDMKYTDKKQGLYINLKAGYQLLDGEQAEGLVRFRHNQDGTTYPEEYGREDLGRTRTQREFLTQLAKQTLTVQNLLKAGDLLDVAYKNVKTNMDLSVMKDYLPYIVKFDTSKIKTGILPGESELCNGYWVYPHNEEETKVLVEELFGDNTEEEENTDKTVTSSEDKTKDLKVELLNGSSSTSALSELTKELKEAGYNVVKATKTSSTAKTIVMKRNVLSAEVESELKKLTGVKSIQSAEDSEDIDVTIIIGKDY